MLKQFNAPDGDSCKEVSYEYDALNFRTKRTSILEGTVTEYAYGRNGALTYEKFTKNSTVEGSRTYAYLNDQIIGFTDSVGSLSSKRYAVTDIQGSVNEIYDESGNLIWKSGYTAFGELAGESVDKLEGVFEFHGMYTGCQIDVETGLTYHWNRWRSEDGSSFITQDPARDGSNWYGYCGQNPVMFQDPTGLLPAGPNQPPVNSSKWLDREKGDKKGNGNGNESEKEAKEPPTKTPETPEQPKVGIDITIPTPEIQQTTPSEITYTAKEISLMIREDPDSNPMIPYYQNSIELQALNDLTMILKDGKLIIDNDSCFRLNACNLMSYLFIVQDYTGYNFSLSEIASIITYGQETENPSKTSEKSLLNNYDVRNPDVIMNKAFEMTGHPELTATAGYNIGNLPCRTYTNIKVLSDLNHEHRVVGDFEGNVIYNPWKGGGISGIIEKIKVYIHGVMIK